MRMREILAQGNNFGLAEGLLSLSLPEWHWRPVMENGARLVEALAQVENADLFPGRGQRNETQFFNIY